MNWTILKTEQEYQSALDRLEEIFDSTPADPSFTEAELLVLLIEQYETTFEEPFPNPDPIEVIKYRMDQNNLNITDLDEILGIDSPAADILDRKKMLSLNMIRKITKALNIPADLLIGEYKTVH